MSAIRTLTAAMALAAVLNGSPCVAQNSLLDRWYTAMFDVNRVAIDDLLAEDAVIQLEDLGLSQTKAEYMDALDEWEDIVKTANFAWQIEEGAPADETNATVLVCYQFPDNELMIREAFTFRDGKIISSVHKTVSDSCEDF